MLESGRKITAVLFGGIANEANVGLKADDLEQRGHKCAIRVVVEMMFPSLENK